MPHELLPSPNSLKVVLLIETSREYGRQLLRGIAKYSRLHGPWTFYREPGGLSEERPPLDKRKVDGIIVRGDSLTPQEVRIEDDFPPHVLIVKTTDGRELRKTYTIRTILSPNAMTREDTIEKFRQCVEFSRARLSTTTEDILGTIENLEQVDRAADLVGKCTG